MENAAISGVPESDISCRVSAWCFCWCKSSVVYHYHRADLKFYNSNLKTL